MLYIESPSVDPYFNLALEQYVFDSLDHRQEYFMLWQNKNAVIIGKNQNTISEVNQAYIKDHNINVVRRLSGGGAVYHDLGNINFTFIVNAGTNKDFDFSTFCTPIVKALASFGISAKVCGRNDITINGMKFSGNAQYIKQGRVMHHGTIMYDCDLDVMRQALASPKDKIDSKGKKSVRSLVTNIKPHMPGDISVNEFLTALRGFMFEEYNLQAYTLTTDDKKHTGDLQTAIYDTWEWNYGYSPACSIIKERKVEGCGKLQIHMDVENGLISKIALFGDFFGNEDIRNLENLMIGRRLEEHEIRESLAGKEIGQFFHNMDIETFISIVMQ